MNESDSKDNTGVENITDQTSTGERNNFQDFFNGIVLPLAGILTAIVIGVVMFIVLSDVANDIFFAARAMR